LDTYDALFSRLTGHPAPHDWQRELAVGNGCPNRLIRIPTGFGKTLGILSAWLHHRVLRDNDDWPRRLVWCLPMRVLVEQTEQEVRAGLERIGRLWDGSGAPAGRVGVHTLMGGADAGAWHLRPEHCAVLIGTQDMLLSRALNRGYGAARARWPVEFGLLNQDCLWVMDEVQLMDVGLATSAQLQAFRLDDERDGKALRPCRTWWMSATLQRDWLTLSPDTTGLVRDLPENSIPAPARTGHLWDDVAKPFHLEPCKDAKGLAKRVAALHLEQGRGLHGPTLVVVNTVERAIEVAKGLQEDKSLGKATEIRLIHSRYRPLERAGWRDAFLNRAACGPHTDRILVATQVIEAGVDLSAALLITELAPWPSLVQRLGRCARWGGTARVVIADFAPKDDKAAAPYAKEALDAAREALALLPGDLAPLHLESFEERHPERLPALYPYQPLHLLLRHELEELFDTTPDLSGADIDISRFIRSGEERDLQAFWAEVGKDETPSPRLQPSREALCAVPFLKARDWLCGKESGTTKAPRLKPGMRAWVWDWLDGEWRRAERRDLYPGQTVLVAADCGGYDPAIGWHPETRRLDANLPLPLAGEDRAEQADAAQDDESLSAYPWQTITFHGQAVGREARAIAATLAPRLAPLLDLAGRWHDSGKAHPAFQGAIRHPQRPAVPLAKAPDYAWRKGRPLYPMPDGNPRPGLRHELASVLALFAVLHRRQPDHPALLGPWRELLVQVGMQAPDPAPPNEPPSPLEQELLALEADRFDLLAYLVCAHHGKVRLAWHASRADQQASDGPPRIRGILDGDELPALTLMAEDGSRHPLPTLRLDLAPAAAGLNPHTGRGWTERVLALLERHGPFTLAWLEALLRVADQRASANPNLTDPSLAKEAP
jgi:CRISPR-associated endonuclease/helicase Cas3